MPKILIIEDDTAFGQMLQKFLTRHRYEVTLCYTLREAKTILATEHFNIILSDVRLPDGDGVAFLSGIEDLFTQSRVVFMTSFAEVHLAVKAMKKGASDYLSKPFTPDDILACITREDELVGASKSSDSGQKVVQEKGSNSKTVEVKGDSEASRKLQQYIALVAPTNMSVLLIGESGTGKEVTARSIHDLSKRKNRNFVAVDCGAIPKELATSEFFGHIKGSFTGAVEDKVGHFEAASDGTLFLDEIGNLTYENQVQLLRALQERKIKRVGSTKEVKINIRVIAATNEDLWTLVQNGRFREDLYHRLNEFCIEIPSLKDRQEDLMAFAKYFLELANADLSKDILGFTDETQQILKSYHWPGNLRELKNVVKRAVLFTEGGHIDTNALPSNIRVGEDRERTEFSKQKFEKERIIKALERTNFNKTEAAKLLNMTRKTLYNKINRYQLKF